MANQITSLKSGFVSVHTEVGENGQGMDMLQKGASDNGNTGFGSYFYICIYIGRSYAAALFEVEAIANLAKKEGKSYGVNGFIFTHGEHDCGDQNYKNLLVQYYKVQNFFF
jgi:hypothetical protein